MIIESLTVKNFRQFMDETKLEFSTDKAKNVTVIHGANGCGKTSLLNAFKWCFYGQTDFDTTNDNILNEATIHSSSPDEKIELKITVRFKHEGKQYHAIRQQFFKRFDSVSAEPTGESDFYLDETRKDGQTIRSKTPFMDLQSILPGDLQPYFFFNGERIEHIAGINQGGQVREAIRKLMGLELVDRTIQHLGKAKNQYRSQLKEKVSEEQRLLHDEIQQFEDAFEKYSETSKTQKDKEDLARSELQRIELQLKRHERSRELQRNRDDINQQIEERVADISATKARQKKLIDEYAFLVISSSLFSECASLVEENRRKGVLPYGINEQFIDDRIELGICICGAEVSPGSLAHTNLLSTRESAGNQEIESTYTGVSALLKSSASTVEKFKNEYAIESRNLLEQSDKLDELQTNVDEISAQLTSVDDAFIANLELSHREQESERDSAIAERGSADNSIRQSKRDIEERKLLLARLEEQESHQSVARSGMQKVEKMISTMDDLRGALTNQVRRDLSERVDATFQSIIRKSVNAVIDEDYCLQIIKTSPTGETYVSSEQSTGERQVTSLSFIASIIALAKEKHSQKKMFFQGGLYPLVMDSPFGALDDDYREKVAAKVSELAEQVIIFVSNSQWNGKVKHACLPKVGKSYQLVHHSPGLAKEREGEYRVSTDSKFEFSTAKEVFDK